MATVGVAVLASVTIHGATATPFSAWYGRRAAQRTLTEEREGTVAGLFADDGVEVPRITAQDLSDRLSETNPPIVLDVRSRSSYEHDGAQIPGSIRVLPDRVIEWAADNPLDRTVVAYCS